ncbi:MAG: hypothetical protein Q9209_002666 [Squamulea sp. 1 TL-2023]
MDSITALSREVNRILNAPYPSSLQTLYKILSLVDSGISPFLAKLLNDAALSPCADNIRPVYIILSGCGSHLLGALPSDVITRTQDQFKNMLHKVKFGIDDNSANLFCLAVLAIILGRENRKPMQEQDEASPPPAARTPVTVESASGSNEARQFFASKRASKTLDLVVLKMIYACSKSCKLNTSEIVESLQVSNVILRAIDDVDRASWMAKSQAKVSKLIEKIISSAHLPEVLCLVRKTSIFEEFSHGWSGFAKHCHTLRRSSTPRSIVTSLETIASDPCSVETPSCYLCTITDESSIQENLLSILQAAEDNTTKGDISCDTEAALALVEGFAISVASSASLRYKILYLLSTNTLADPLRRFLKLGKGISFDYASDDHKIRCPYSCAERRLLLRRKICTMLLKTSFYFHHDTLSLDSSTASALLDSIVDTERTLPACRVVMNAIKPRRPVSLSIFETGNTPCSSAESDLWRKRVKSELAQNADYQYQKVIRIMEDVCQDLERRCNEVEAPLRDEKTKSTNLHAELEESKLHMAKISSHAHEQSLILEGIEREKSELVARVRDLEQEQTDLSSRMEDLRDELAKTTQQTEDADRNHRKKVEELELMHAAVVAERDETHEAQDRKERAYEAQNNQLEADVAELRAKVSGYQDDVVRLEATLSEQQIELCSANHLICEKQSTMDCQEELLNCLGTDKSQLQNEVTRLSNIHQDLRAELDHRAAMINSQSVELRKLHCDHEAELARLRQSSDEKAEKLEHLLNERAQDAVLAVQRFDSRVLQLEDELAKSKAELDDRDNELEEAQALNDQVMAFWNKQRRRNATSEEPAGKHDSRTPGKKHHERTSVRFPNQSPEHKRSRTTRSFVSSVQSGKKAGRTINLRDSATRKKSTPLRRPLADVDARLQTQVYTSPTRISPHKGKSKQSSDENDFDENTQPGMTEGSLCDSDFFASTDHQLIANIHSDAPHLELPDDTTEF